jgi:hypothetical protein
MALAQYPQSESCYLDGRYFNLALANYPGLIRSPLIVTFRENRSPNRMSFSQSVAFEGPLDIDRRQPGLLRVVIDTPDTRHSNLVILDYANGQAYRFEPLGSNAPYFLEVNRAIKDLLHRFELTLNIIEVPQPLDEKQPGCVESGYCNAYNILYAQAFLEGTDFNPNQIRRFVSMLENQYEDQLTGEPEVEYGPYDNQVQNTVIGGAVGGLAGGLLLGPPGLLLGGLGGAAIGSTVR